MAVDSFSHSSDDVLQDLDALSRALLDLSLGRGMEDAEIADVLGTDEVSVLEVRVGLLRATAEKIAPEHVDDEVHVLQSLMADRLYGDPDGEAEEIAALEAAVPEPAPKPAPAAVRASRPAERPRRRSPLLFLLPLLLVVAVIGLVVILAGSGDDDGGNSRAPRQSPATASKPGAAQPKAAASPRPTSKRARLTAVEGGASGTATLTGDRLKLKLHGLPAAQGGTYTVWLYNSIIDARSLGSPKSAKLPAGASRYRYLDVSLEPADGNRNHSGRSVLRVPLKKLR